MRTNRTNGVHGLRYTCFILAYPLIRTDFEVVSDAQKRVWSLRSAFLSQKRRLGFVWYFNMGLFGKFIFFAGWVYDTRLALFSPFTTKAPRHKEE